MGFFAAVPHVANSKCFPLLPSNYFPLCKSNKVCVGSVVASFVRAASCFSAMDRVHQQTLINAPNLLFRTYCTFLAPSRQTPALAAARFVPLESRQSSLFVVLFLREKKKIPLSTSFCSDSRGRAPLGPGGCFGAVPETSCNFF